MAGADADRRRHWSTTPRRGGAGIFKGRSEQEWPRMRTIAVEEADCAVACEEFDACHEDVSLWHPFKSNAAPGGAPGFRRRVGVYALAVGSVGPDGGGGRVAVEPTHGASVIGDLGVGAAGSVGTWGRGLRGARARFQVARVAVEVGRRACCGSHAVRGQVESRAPAAGGQKATARSRETRGQQTS